MQWTTAQGRGAIARSFPYFVAVGAWCGALVPIDAPMVGALGVLVGSLVLRRRAVVGVACTLAASILAANALGGLTPLAEGPWQGTARLVADPAERGGGTSVDVDTASGRMELTAWGAPGRVLDEASAGEEVWLSGTVVALRRSDSTIARHVRDRLRATTVRRLGRTAWWMVVPNAIRGVVLDGAAPLPTEQRPVYAGFVLGDDRGRSEDLTMAFERAGLLHLLVVSGENLVFILLVAAPILGRLGRRSRMVATLGLLALFAAMTRFEPSVLRATAMATIAVVAVAADRRVTGRRTLALAVTALVLIDPLLVHSLGFRLSVAASAGIVLLAPVIERRLRGPQRLRTGLAVTIAAQAAVAPLIIPVFGPMPLVAIPANVLAEPIAGLVMMWGSSVGLVAGIVGGPVALVLQLPTRLGLWWVIGVAERASSLPAVGVSLPMLIGLAIGSLTVMVVGRHRRRRRSTMTREPSVG